jgi:hypothetical protein
MKPGPRTFYFVSGLLYPGALGVALTWLAQAASTFVVGSGKTPSVLVICFVLWIMTYHSFWFARLMHTHSRWSSDPDSHGNGAYTWPALLSDVIDCVVVFAVFAVLGFQPDATQDLPSPGWIYLIAMGVPLSALVSRFKKLDRKRAGLIVAVSVVNVAGAILNWTRTSLESWNAIPLAMLWVLLAIYLADVFFKEN